MHTKASMKSKLLIGVKISEYHVIAKCVSRNTIITYRYCNLECNNAFFI